jgi:hypothetical protein
MKGKTVKALVIQAMQGSRYRWRTARGISKDTDIFLQQVIDFLEASPAILRSKKANSRGQPLYALKEPHRHESDRAQDLSTELLRSKETQLHNFLLSLFSYDELHYLIGLLPNGRVISAELDFSGPPYIVVHELVDALSRREAIDSNFFELLFSLRPHEAETIRLLWGQWEPQPEEWSQPPSTRKPDDRVPTSPDRQKEHVAGHVFVSYSRRDSTFFEELRTHLTLLP